MTTFLNSGRKFKSGNATEERERHVYSNVWRDVLKGATWGSFHLGIWWKWGYQKEITGAGFPSQTFLGFAPSLRVGHCDLV